VFESEDAAKNSTCWYHPKPACDVPPQMAAKVGEVSDTSIPQQTNKKQKLKLKSKSNENFYIAHISIPRMLTVQLDVASLFSISSKAYKSLDQSYRIKAISRIIKNEIFVKWAGVQHLHSCCFS
jgi:predicted transcriptional regulator